MFKRYTEIGKWFKGNTHVHTILSDGGMTPDKTAILYQNAGYDFICITDHWHPFKYDQLHHSTAGTDRGIQNTFIQFSGSKKQACFTQQSDSSKFLILNGIEIDGRDKNGQYYHVVALGTFKPMKPSSILEQTISTLLHQGAFLILAHPYWCGNSFDDVWRFPFHSVEIYNHICNSLNCKGYAVPYWDKALLQMSNISAIAADDAHLLPEHPEWNGGWIMVQAPELTPNNLINALRHGSFYSTTGPEFKKIIFDGSLVHCETTPIRKAFLIGADQSGDSITAPDNDIITKFTFNIKSDSNLALSPYLRIEIADTNGKHAWTNNLYN